MANGDSKIWISGDLLADDYKDYMINIKDGKAYRKAPVKGFMASPMLRIRDVYDLKSDEREILTSLIEAYIEKKGELPPGMTVSKEAKPKIFMKVEEKKPEILIEVEEKKPEILIEAEEKKPETPKVVKIPIPKKLPKKPKKTETKANAREKLKEKKKRKKKRWRGSDDIPA